jgi:hypothetical protein
LEASNLTADTIADAIQRIVENKRWVLRFFRLISLE